MLRAKACAPDLDFKRVEKYVRRAPALLLPKGWSHWPNGRPPLEPKLLIDDELDRLSRGPNRILSADEVRVRYPKIYWPSHEIAIRAQLVWYADFEFIDSIAGDAEVAQLHRKQLPLLESAETSLIQLRKLHAEWPVPCHPQLTSNVQSAFELVRDLKIWIKWSLHERRPPQGGRPSPKWKRQFVLRLAAFWHIITDKQPSTSRDKDFVELVSAAWNSLHPDIPEIDWDSFVDRFAESASLDEALETTSMATLWANVIRRP
jgi:hypothetical protein